jgi:hypothetical protein
MTHTQAIGQLFPRLETAHALRTLRSLHLEFALPDCRRSHYNRAVEIVRQLVAQHETDGGVTLVLDLDYTGCLALAAEQWFVPGTFISRNGLRDGVNVEPILSFNPLKGVDLVDLDDYYVTRFGQHSEKREPVLGYLLQVAEAIQARGLELSFPALAGHSYDLVTRADTSLDETIFADVQRQCEFVGGVSYNTMYDYSGLAPSKQAPVDVVALLREGTSMVVGLPRPGDQATGYLLLASVVRQWRAAAAEGAILPELHVVLHGNIGQRPTRFLEVLQPALRELGIGMTVLPGYSASRSGEEYLKEHGWAVGVFPDFDAPHDLEIRANEGTRKLGL